jgi:RecQ-mediated genome instability protein 1
LSVADKQQWVSECVAALLADGQTATPESVEEQYLYADLGASTRHSPGSGIPIPQNDESAELHNKTLFPVPTLVQIHSVAEIGASAFALNTTLEQRRDIISGATRIRRLEDEEDEQQAEKGPPPYPRSMLVMDVSDGRTALRAIEYRRITGLTLGATPLGTKVSIRVGL